MGIIYRFPPNLAKIPISFLCPAESQTGTVVYQRLTWDIRDWRDRTYPIRHLVIPTTRTSLLVLPEKHGDISPIGCSLLPNRYLLYIYISVYIYIHKIYIYIYDIYIYKIYIYKIYIYIRYIYKIYIYKIYI